MPLSIRYSARVTITTELFDHTTGKFVTSFTTTGEHDDHSHYGAKPVIEKATAHAIVDQGALVIAATNNERERLSAGGGNATRVTPSRPS